MDVLMQASQTQCFTKAGLAAGTTTTLTQTLVGGATANIFAIRGKTYSAAALSNTATPTADWATGKAFLPILANQGSVFLVGFDHSGTLRVVQGNIVPLDTVTVPGAFLSAPQFGASGPAGSGTNDGDFCPVGYLVVQCGPTANNIVGWSFGTNNMSGVTGVTYTLDDVCGFIDRPSIT